MSPQIHTQSLQTPALVSRYKVIFQFIVYYEDPLKEA